MSRRIVQGMDKYRRLKGREWVNERMDKERQRGAWRAEHRGYSKNGRDYG
jgi:hypothetical protein